MLTESIKQKIQELFDNTPDNVSVSYGKKITNGQYTGEIGITFFVETKLPIEVIPAEELLPSSITIDGVEYVTDVVPVGKIGVLVCDSTTLNNCYAWQTSAPGNRGTIRPLKGGISVTSYNNQDAIGTLGFMAVDTFTQALVGISNNHVLISDGFYTSNRNLTGLKENELSDNVYQTGETGTNPALKIGEVLRYVPLNLSSTNTVDVAMTSVASADISNSESIKQYGLSNSTAMPFASTSEINNLLSTNPLLYSSGRTSGAKGEGLCGLRVLSIGVSAPISGYTLQGATKTINFSDCIVFTRTNPECPSPIASGDSGSALIANFSGTWKIIGLVFAGGTSASNYVGFANRIDNVASQLSIQSWDGTSKNYVDLASKTNKTIAGGSSNATLNCNGSTYWQVGLTNISSPC
jgi:hypothetical protein